MFHLTIGTDDTYAFIADPTHVCPAVGYVDSDVLGGRRPVERGMFNLFVDAGEINERTGPPHALPAVVQRRGRPPAHPDRVQGHQPPGRRRLVIQGRVGRDHDAVHQNPGRPRRGRAATTTPR